MRINLNNPAQFTLEGVRALLASKDDSQHRQLRVDQNGDAYLSDMFSTNTLQNVKFRFETWCMGNGYCGAEAAADDKYVQTVYDDLRIAWTKGLTGFIDYPLG